MTDSDDFAMEGLKFLRRTVAEALERKRLLGQCAVFWRNGRVVLEGPDAPDEPAAPDASE